MTMISGDNRLKRRDSIQLTLAPGRVVHCIVDSFEVGGLLNINEFVQMYELSRTYVAVRFGRSGCR